MRDMMVSLCYLHHNKNSVTKRVLAHTGIGKAQGGTGLQSRPVLSFPFTSPGT